jgi:hypothetical protein
MILKITLEPATPDQDESLKEPTTIWAEVESVKASGHGNDPQSDDTTFTYSLRNCPIVGDDCEEKPALAYLTNHPHIMLLYIEWPSKEGSDYAEFKVSAAATVPGFPGLDRR